MDPLDVDTWNGDWTWSLPLIVLTVVVHVFSLVFMNDLYDDFRDETVGFLYQLSTYGAQLTVGLRF
jgi:hypothetical protein